MNFSVHTIPSQVNELTWNNEGDLFFLTSGQGSIHILSYPDLKLQHVIQVWQTINHSIIQSSCFWLLVCEMLIWNDGLIMKVT